MPVLKHAKKKLRQDVRRTQENKKVKESFKRLLKQAKAKPSKDSVRDAFQAIDKAAQKNVIHENKAARLKSNLSKIVEGKAQKPPEKKTTTKKAAAKKKAARTSKKK